MPDPKLAVGHMVALLVEVHEMMAIESKGPLDSMASPQVSLIARGEHVGAIRNGCGWSAQRLLLLPATSTVPLNSTPEMSLLLP